MEWMAKVQVVGPICKDSATGRGRRAAHDMRVRIGIDQCYRIYRETWLELVYSHNVISCRRLLREVLALAYERDPDR